MITVNNNVISFAVTELEQGTYLFYQFYQYRKFRMLSSVLQFKLPWEVNVPSTCARSRG